MKNNHPFQPTHRSSLFLLVLLAIGQQACVKKAFETVAVPVITSVNKNVLHVGDTLLITGSGFSADTAANLVALAGGGLRVYAASTTRLSTIIPGSAQTGQLTVNFAAGKAAAYDSIIQIIGFTQPYITSVTPSTAYPGDTIIIRGGNFGSPSTTNSVIVSSIPFTVYNSTDSLIRVIVPDVGHSGSMTVTSNGAISPAVNFTVLRPDPLADGRIYFGVGQANITASMNFSYLYRGSDVVFSFPYGTLAYNNTTSNEFQKPPATATNGSGLEPLYSDAQGNFYYLYNVLKNTTATKEWRLAKFTPGTFERTVIWDQDFTTATNSIFRVNPTKTINFINTPGTPLSIDGNTIYIKIGISNVWYTADLTASTPVFTKTGNLVPDTSAFGVQFTPNYIFYKSGGSSGTTVDLVAQLNYMRRGSTTVQTISIPSTDRIGLTIADSKHGDNILVFTQATTTPFALTIYKFNAATQQLQLLYNTANWADAPQRGLNNYFASGFLWAGSHIYYTDKRRSPLNTTLNQYSYNGLFVLNDDGSSTRLLNVYPRLEPAAMTTAGTYTPMFITNK